MLTHAQYLWLSRLNAVYSNHLFDLLTRLLLLLLLGVLLQLLAAMMMLLLSLIRRLRLNKLLLKHGNQLIHLRVRLAHLGSSWWRDQLGALLLLKDLRLVHRVWVPHG